MLRLFGGYPMRALQSRLPQNRRLSSKWHRALQLLVSNPRGIPEHMLVLGYGWAGARSKVDRAQTVVTSAIKTMSSLSVQERADVARRWIPA